MNKVEGDALWSRLVYLQQQYCCWTDQNQLDIASETETDTDWSRPPASYRPDDLVRLSHQILIWERYLHVAMTQ